MLEAVASVVLVASTPFIQYAPPTSRQPPQIEAIVDRGPIIELIVRCPAGTAIVSYSKVERVFCSPKGSCSGNRVVIFRQSCN